MKMYVYYVVNIVHNGTMAIYEAGPFKCWNDAWGYVQGVNSLNPEKDLYIVKNKMKVKV